MESLEAIQNRSEKTIAVSFQHQNDSKASEKGGGIKCGLTGYVATYASLAVYISISMKLIATHLNKKIIFSDCTLCIF